MPQTSKMAAAAASTLLPHARGGGGRARRAAQGARARALLASDIDAVEAERIGLVNSVVPSAEWASAVEQTVNTLARTFSQSVADGKRTFYRQSEVPALLLLRCACWCCRLV